MCFQAKPGQVMKSEVEVIKDGMVIISLRLHARGRLAFLPAQRVSVYVVLLDHVGVGWVTSMPQMICFIVMSCTSLNEMCFKVINILLVLSKSISDFQ